MALKPVMLKSKPVAPIIQAKEPKVIGQKGGYRMLLRAPAANKADSSGEIYLYGTIGSDWFGDGVTAKQLADDLKTLGAVSQIDIRINSEGGSVFDGKAMYSLLQSHAARKVVYIDGLAASAASFIAMVGDEINISEGAFVMIHRVRGGKWGTSEDLRNYADLIDQVNQTTVATYIARTGQSQAKIESWMKAETWFEAADAVKYGFADKLVESLRVAACITDFGLSNYTRVPGRLRPRLAAASERLARLRA